MASHKKVNWWAVFFAAWTAFYLLLVVIVTVPDYPRHGHLWYVVTMDPNGYFHELWYLTIGYFVGIAAILLNRLTLYLFEVSEFLKMIKRFP